MVDRKLKLGRGNNELEYVVSCLVTHETKKGRERKFENGLWCGDDDSAESQRLEHFYKTVGWE
jgi:hypothetical protein